MHNYSETGGNYLMHNSLETSGSIKCAKQLDGHPKAGGVKLLAPDKLGPAHPLRAPGRGRRIPLLDRLGSASSKCGWIHGGSALSRPLWKIHLSDASPPI